jgi:hypothetical protein
MDENVIVLIIAGCCLFSCCVGLFLRVYYGTDAAKTILSKGLIADAMAGFKFDTSSGLPNIQKRTSTIRPNSFKKRINFGAPRENNIGEPQDKDDVNCSVLCFDTEGCTGYAMENGKCQLKGNVTIINYEKGKEIHVSTDIGGTKYGQVPYDLLDKAQPKLWSKSDWTLAQAADNCWASSECTGFTYVNGVATMYGNAFVLDSGSTGNTYVKFDFMDKSGFGQKTTKYTDTASSGGFHIDSQFFKSDNGFVAPPAPPPGAPDWKYYDNDLLYFKKESDPNWNAGKDKRGADPKKISGVDTAKHCANVCMSNASCKSFVFKEGSKECFFRSDLSRDNDKRFVCNSKPVLNDSINKCRGGEEIFPYNRGAECQTSSGDIKAVAQCWEEDGSFSETGAQTYWKLQDPMEKQCPDACGPNGLCQASMWTKNDCSIFEFKPTVKATTADAANFTTQWKFDYFPGQ